MERREEKKALRSLLKECRSALPTEKTELWDAAVLDNVVNSRWFAEADTVFVYLSVGREVDTSAIVQAARKAGKQVAAPRCAPAGQMSFFLIEGDQDLGEGKYGIPEPKVHCQPAKASEGSLCLVPGLAFDRTGFRIGYGGGYYDRFLAGFCGKSIGLARSCFLYDRLPTEEYDLSVDAVVTDQGFLFIR